MIPAVDDEAAIRRILGHRTWAVVGCSPDPARPSHRVAAFLQSQRYRVIPVHPAGGTILGETCYTDLLSLPDPGVVEVVDIFRRAGRAGRHVDEAIAIGARAVWMQIGVVDHAAAARARQVGLDVVMDRCPAIEHPRLFGAGRNHG